MEPSFKTVRKTINEEIKRKHMITIRQILRKEDLDEFKSYEKEKLHVLKIGAPWCGPCRVLESTLKGLNEEKVKGVLFAEISMDDDATEDLAAELNVRGVPVMIYFKGGKEQNRTVGLVTADVIYKNIESLK